MGLNLKVKHMSRIVFVNGEFVPEEEAKVSIFDRGFLMADAVYEVTTVLEGKLIAFDGQLVLFTQAKNPLANPMYETGARVITVPDQRWGRRDIKCLDGRRWFHQ